MLLVKSAFIGLFGSAYYTNSALDLPMIKSKVAAVFVILQALRVGTHAYKTLINILETYPQVTRFYSRALKELLHNVKGILQMQERDYSGLFVRKDAFGAFLLVHGLRASRALQHQVTYPDATSCLQEAFGSDQEVEFNTYFSESVQARTHYIVRVDNTKADINVKEIEKNLNEAARSWDDKLSEALKLSQR